MGSKVSAPPAPDYKGAAEATAKGNQVAAQQNTIANRPNINTPFGSQTWNNNKTFDQAGYDAALASYNSTATQGRYEDAIDNDGNTTQRWVAGTGPTGNAPDRNAFTTDNWTQNTTLAPQAQAALDSQLAMQRGRSDLANSLMPRVAESINKPFDFSGLQEWGKGYQGPGVAHTSVPTTADKLQTSIGNTPDYIKSSGDAIYNQATSRLDPRFTQMQSDLDARLANQGITAGSEAYNRAQNNLSLQRNDAYQTAMNNATTQAGADAVRTQGMDLNQANFGNTAQNQIFGQNLNAANFGNQAQQQDFAQQMNMSNYQNTLRQAQFAMQQQERLQPLNEMNALITGQQVGMPQMPTFNQATPYKGVDYMGATAAQGAYDMNTFNAQQAANGGLMSGLFSLGGSAMMAGAMSDRRLKKIIRRVGKLANGLSVYRFKYLGMPGVHTGVMAQDVARVRPDCVIQTSSGFMAVNYSKLLGA